MNRIDKFIISIYSIIYILIGIVLVLIEENCFTKTEFIKLLGLEYISGIDQILLIIIGTIVCILAISILNMLFTNKEAKKAVIFKTEKGEIKVTFNAIEDFIKKKITKMKEVKDIRTGIIVYSKIIKIKAKVILFSDTSVIDVTQKIQREIQIGIKEMLGKIDFNIKVDVNIIKMICSKNFDKENKEKEEDGFYDEKEFFQGIQY